MTYLDSLVKAMEQLVIYHDNRRLEYGKERHFAVITAKKAEIAMKQLEPKVVHSRRLYEEAIAVIEFLSKLLADEKTDLEQLV